eukprot:TRINITY_DN3123_c0_g1_i3.p1 TRINITY_DN3123_c0_g1~~TRINITY_DN3123_c0_g1_i3.p1  ORF type:complete len:360 (-),score=57.78 TRINITY_DN3123_c0_g1_i3:265-1344(-)
MGVEPKVTSAGGRREGNYYAVLGLSFEATEEEIRREYHNVVRTLHPDRKRPGSCSAEMLEQFHKVQSAWRCLSDPTRRLLYDLRNFGVSSTRRGKEEGLGCVFGPEAESKLVQLQKEQAERDVRNMETLLETILNREQACRGVVVRKALYGDLRLRAEKYEEGMLGTRTILPEDLIGPYVDVTLPVQSLVEQHTIVIPGGACASKSDLPGFYNPVPLDYLMELNLYVQYDFLGRLHEVVVGDCETLSLPYRKHAVPPNKEPRGPFSPANLTLWRNNTIGGEGRSPVPLAGRLSSRRGGMQSLTSKKALEKAVLSYRFQSLSPLSIGDATPREFLAVLAVTGTSVVLAWYFSNKKQSARR